MRDIFPLVARPEEVLETSMDSDLVCRTSHYLDGVFPKDPPVLANPRRARSKGLNTTDARVYFLAGAGLIKIGVSTQPDKRIRAIRNSSPVPLELLGMHKAGGLFEMLAHGRFAHLRKHGEWFEDCLELRDFIDAVLSGRGYDLRPGAPR